MREPDSTTPEVPKIPSGNEAARDSDAPAAPKRWIQCSDDEKAQRIQDAEELSRMNGILCTGAPEQRECRAPAVVAIVLRGRLYALPCLAHTGAIGTHILGQGHSGMRQISIAEMLEVHGEAFVTSATVIREANIEHGITLAPGAYSRSQGS